MDKKCLPCKWHGYFNRKVTCTINGKVSELIADCPMETKESFAGFAVYDNGFYGTYILAEQNKNNVDQEFENNITFNSDNLMKYEGKKIKITVEVVYDFEEKKGE